MIPNNTLRRWATAVSTVLPVFGVLPFELDDSAIEIRRSDHSHFIPISEYVCSWWP